MAFWTCGTGSENSADRKTAIPETPISGNTQADLKIIEKAREAIRRSKEMLAKLRKQNP
jgi:hypothetical protein